MPTSWRDKAIVVQLLGGMYAIELWDRVLQFINILLSAQALVPEDDGGDDCAGDDGGAYKLGSTVVVWAERWHGRVLGM